MSERDTSQPDFTTLVDVWNKHENVAMHFNDLIIRIRTQALGALAALITIGGALIHDVPAGSSIPWDLVAAFLAVLAAFWIAIWILDFAYYDRLLRGAVDAILALERRLKAEQAIPIQLSHAIQRAVKESRPAKIFSCEMWGPIAFYGIVLAVLLCGLCASLAKAF